MYFFHNAIHLFVVYMIIWQEEVSSCHMASWSYGSSRG